MCPVPFGAARSKSETLIVIGFAPPLKYGPTGVAKILNWYSSAGLTPITGELANIYGLIYNVAPDPYGGTYAAFSFTT